MYTKNKDKYIYMDKKDTEESNHTYRQVEKNFVADVYAAFNQLSGEITERNETISKNDQFIYGDLLETSLDIPIGHDKTPVNWLRRTVEIHKTQFMGRPFQLLSTYDTKDSSSAEDEQDKGRIDIENKKQKEYAEQRKNMIDSIIRDNGGHSLYMEGAESASAIGSFVIKTYYDADDKKFVTTPVEAVENCYALWNKDDYRSFDAFAYVNQISKDQAIRKYSVNEDVPTSAIGKPFAPLSPNNQNITTNSQQQMVTVIDVTGIIPCWKVKDGKLVSCKDGEETPMSMTIVGDMVYGGIMSEEKKMPKYYVFPNKKQRRRPWGVADISDAAIEINATYIETLSDWRTLAAKVNFPKYKGYNFGPDTQIPKPKSRQVQILPLAEGQDIVPLNQGDAKSVDFRQQLDEAKEQFVRETGISRVLFDDPSVTLNSNQALLTSMKPTSDIAETKKQLWTPILERMFREAIETIALWEESVKELADETMTWELRTQWPSVMQKDDPTYQTMLINRFNAGTMSLQSFLEQQGETKEEIDRIREELSDPVTAAILGHQIPLLAQQQIMPQPDPNAKTEPEVRHSVSWQAQMTPQQEANLAATIPGFQDGPFGASMGPQGTQGKIAGENANNVGTLNGDPYKGGTPKNTDASGKDVGNYPQPSNQQPAMVNTTANNQEGNQVMSQPGTPSAPVSQEGAINAPQQGA